MVIADFLIFIMFQLHNITEEVAAFFQTEQEELFLLVITFLYLFFSLSQSATSSCSFL